jgi:signal transduction histidine kinase
MVRVVLSSASSSVLSDVPTEGVPRLARLLSPPEIDTLLQGLATTCAVAVLGSSGEVIAGVSIASPDARAAVHCGIHVVGEVVAAGAGAEATAGGIRCALELACRHSYARSLVSVAHQVAMKRTLSELSERNRRLERAVERMNELDRLKTGFLSTVSHELRTPLTAIMGYSEMLLEGLGGPLAAQQRDYLRTILGKAGHLLELIGGILEMSSLESGEVVPQTVPLDLADLVLDVIKGLSPLAGQRGIRIEADLSSHVVLGDRRQLRQVVTQLLSNAIKFSLDLGAVQVSLIAGPVEPRLASSPGGVHLVVGDRGIGIPPEAVHRIFEPFFQADSSSTRQYGGAGLGLTLAKAYVEAHGGKIWVESGSECGSTFVATFPVPPPSAE